ncbi:hypothetical protein [Coleofasciculus sp. H7-2]|uniref:hypothetical protein n=1 Tax=Coleofasciculus sp. H7-2 TaxID=3351545 RepID=UPI003672626B
MADEERTDFLERFAIASIVDLGLVVGGITSDRPLSNPSELTLWSASRSPSDYLDLLPIQGLRIRYH